MYIKTHILPKAIGPNMQPQQSVIDMWRAVKNVTNFQTMMEIGFGVGHSSTIVMTLFPDVTVYSFDIANDERTIQGARIVDKEFPFRHQFYKYDSVVLRQEFNEGITNVCKQDLLFLDGNPKTEIVINDLHIAKERNIPFVFVNNSNVESIKQGIEAIDFLKPIQTYLYTQRKGKKQNISLEATLFKLVV